MQSLKRKLVSDSLPKERKRETSGNETGNGEEIKAPFLCKTGNQVN
jgi:hypothetical protein